MPPARRLLIEYNNNIEYIHPSYLCVQDHLRDIIWEKMKEYIDQESCCICEENFNCKHCFQMTVCGHMICLPCLHKLKKIQCPVCRFPSK